MWYLIGQFWLWLLLALIIGGVVGWITYRGRDEGFVKGLVPWGLVIGGGALVSFLRIFPNGLGFWFDLGMLMLVSYFIGCFLGYLLRGRNAADAGLAVATPVAAMAVKEVAVEPAKAAAAQAEAEAPEEAIIGLSGPRGGKGDDLTQIHGIDAETQKKLNALGIYHYDQLAGMNPGQRRWLFTKLGYAGRFPSWWWRWKYDAEQILGAKAKPAAAEPAVVKPVAAKPVAVAAPVAAAAPVGADGHAGSKPRGLEGPRGGKADDLKRIRGIGKQNEGRLHALGIWHFDQVAAWSKDEALWVGSYLAFPGRIEREEWISQAKVLASGGVTEFAKRVDKGEVATSKDDGNKGQGNVAKLDKPIAKPKT